ncbi:MAG: septum site-determining protein MinC [Tissierella sp.]|nr:septum site-determining protein MinC [Tissierella sp.]
MKKESITFKGVKEGVYLEIVGSDIKQIKNELKTKMMKSSSFFQGTTFLGVKADELTSEEILEISLVLKYKYDFNLRIDGDFFKEIIKSYQDEETGENLLSDISKEGMTKFLHGTLRSGQIIEYNGNIVVVGDVNPGAILKARGNIIVLGSLKGVAYAGLDGNMDVIVAAYQLLPTQLRIGEIIVRAPDGDVSEYRLPEVAKICNGEIVIEPYLPNK